MAFIETFEDDDGLSEEDGRASEGERILEQLARWSAEDAINVWSEFDADTLSQIGARVVDEWQLDRTRRADWEQEARLATAAGAQKTETENNPFEGGGKGGGGGGEGQPRAWADKQSHKISQPCGADHARVRAVSVRD